MAFCFFFLRFAASAVALLHVVNLESGCFYSCATADMYVAALCEHLWNLEPLSPWPFEQDKNIFLLIEVAAQLLNRVLSSRLI